MRQEIVSILMRSLQKLSRLRCVIDSDSSNLVSNCIIPANTCKPSFDSRIHHGILYSASEVCHRRENQPVYRHSPLREMLFSLSVLGKRGPEIPSILTTPSCGYSNSSEKPFLRHILHQGPSFSNSWGKHLHSFLSIWSYTCSLTPISVLYILAYVTHT